MGIISLINYNESFVNGICRFISNYSFCFEELYKFFIWFKFNKLIYIWIFRIIYSIFIVYGNNEE